MTSVSLISLANSACSFLLRESVTTHANLRQGMTRSEVIQILGQPTRTQTFQPWANSSTLPDLPKKAGHGKIERRDDFKIGKLSVLPGEPENNVYPAIFILTGGLSELIALPYHAMEIPAKALDRRWLVVWYDRSERVHAFAVP